MFGIYRRFRFVIYDGEQRILVWVFMNEQFWLIKYPIFFKYYRFLWFQLFIWYSNNLYLTFISYYIGLQRVLYVFV